MAAVRRAFADNEHPGLAAYGSPPPPSSPRPANPSTVMAVTYPNAKTPDHVCAPT
jgi:hypothetical protein